VTGSSPDSVQPNSHPLSHSVCYPQLTKIYVFFTPHMCYTATHLTLFPLIMLMTAYLRIYKGKQYTLSHGTRGHFIHPMNTIPAALKVSVLSNPMLSADHMLSPDEFTILPACIRDSPLIISPQLHGFCSTVSLHVFTVLSKHNSRSQWPHGLRQLAYWDCWFESHRRHGCLSIVSVVCYQVEVPATGWSLVQRSPTDCGASSCVI